MTQAQPRLDIPRPRPPMVEAPRQRSGIAALLDRAANTGVPRLIKVADKIQELAEQLEQEVAEHERGAELRAEAERLEARLAEIKGQLGGKRPAPAAGARVDTKAVRAWAAKNGMDCPARGRVPHAVMQAYERRAEA